MLSIRSLSFRVSHSRFSLVFAALLYAACNALNMSALTKWFQGKDGLNVAGFAAYLLAGYGLFAAFFLLLSHRWTTKPLAMIMAVASGAVTYFIAKYGVAIDASMIANAIHTDATEVSQLLSWQMVPYVAFLIVLPMSIVGLSQITFATGGRYLLSSLKYFSICVVSAVALLYSPSRQRLQQIHRLLARPGQCSLERHQRRLAFLEVAFQSRPERRADFRPRRGDRQFSGRAGHRRNFAAKEL
jgi:glucan phosphoethanolaminetransferase (alkaline phosphatase superfamily)